MNLFLAATSFFCQDSRANAGLRPYNHTAVESARLLWTRPAAEEPLLSSKEVRLWPTSQMHMFPCSPDFFLHNLSVFLSLFGDLKRGTNWSVVAFMYWSQKGADVSQLLRILDVSIKSKPWWPWRAPTNTPSLLASMTLSPNAALKSSELWPLAVRLNVFSTPFQPVADKLYRKNPLSM